MESKWQKGLQYDSFLDILFTIFGDLESKDQDLILEKLNTIKIQTSVDIESQKDYYIEFYEVFGDFGEEDTISELMFLTGRKDLGSIERLKYLTMWYDMRVEKGLYEGMNL